MTGPTMLVAAHTASALVCLLLGGYQLLRRIKGDRTHRIAGWMWVTGMLFVATSSFAIRDLSEGRLSLLHVLSVVTLVSLVAGILAARRGDLRGHRSAMLGSWLGLTGAFLGAVAVPGRLIPTFVVTEPLGALAAGATVVALTVALILLARWADRRTGTGRRGLISGSPELRLDDRAPTTGRGR
ncbi:DUF2306 domain-containing protein [Pseudonocardia asaccharolytica]|uniref:Membrane protein n=1 Tax=Pseudonocardia asaccharolytica DSM 44247 = NBRC 16224 TaxID=1123024 RepID=A0A511D2V6_9PSEU|nr:DUF2306 domain-containing protein [Pseudonocardia asaccharolytica]GEL19115.1 membrane protein [Pseudonocardia asaccharolytica DSM 44247 = NBRC 16224]